MSLLIFIFVFLLGTIIGSFLNVVIFRFNTGKTIVTGRSMCMTCSRELRWYELIPVLSFLIQSGKCRRCAAKISHQYPLVEVLTGVMFALVAYKFLSVLYVSYWMYLFLVVLYVFIFSLLIVISVYDLRHKIIPDRLAFIFIFISFLTIFINPSLLGPVFVLPTFGALIAGPLFALPFVALWYFSKGRLMGLGDGKLIFGIGWLLGISAGVFALILSFWVGTIVSLLLMAVYRKKVNMKTEIPFAPFLIVSTFVTFLLSLDVSSLIKIFTF